MAEPCRQPARPVIHFEEQPMTDINAPEFCTDHFRCYRFKVCVAVAIAPAWACQLTMQVVSAVARFSSHWGMQIDECPKQRPHDWTQCPFAHHGERAARRPPQGNGWFAYSGTACAEFKRVRQRLCFRRQNIVHHNATQLASVGSLHRIVATVCTYDRRPGQQP